MAACHESRHLGSSALKASGAANSPIPRRCIRSLSSSHINNRSSSFTKTLGRSTSSITTSTNGCKGSTPSTTLGTLHSTVTQAGSGSDANESASRPSPKSSIDVDADALQVAETDLIDLKVVDLPSVWRAGEPARRFLYVVKGVPPHNVDGHSSLKVTV